MCTACSPFESSREVWPRTTPGRRGNSSRCQSHLQSKHRKCLGSVKEVSRKCQSHLQSKQRKEEVRGQMGYRGSLARVCLEGALEGAVRAEGGE